MHRHELFAAVRELGLNPTLPKLYHALATGRLPEPDRDKLGNRLFGRDHVESFARYLRNPPRRGRPRLVTGGAER